MLKQYLEAGKIVGTHGIRGAVRVQPWSDSGDFLTGFKSFFLDGGGEKKLDVLKAQPHGNIVIITFKGVQTVEQAEAYRGRVIYINRNDVSLPEGRYFVDDLIGCRVLDADDGREYGRVADVSATGANDVWHIEKDGKEYLVPVIDEVVVSVDVGAEKIVIRPLKGIFDDED